MALARKVRRRARDYKSLRTIPASVSIAFIIASVYQFGGMTETTLTWIGVTLSSAMVMPVSLVAILIALSSSETDAIGDYSGPEQGLIASMFVVLFGWQLTPPDWWAAHLPVLGQFVHDTLLSIGDPTAGVLSFLITVVGWFVLVN